MHGTLKDIETRQRREGNLLWYAAVILGFIVLAALNIAADDRPSVFSEAVSGKYSDFPYAQLH